jgi:hypothetical protein
MLFPPLTEYAWMSGHNVALASLRSVETDIGARNRRTSDDALQRVAIASQPVNKFPVREKVLSGKVIGSGTPEHQWTMTLCTLGIKYVFDAYLSSGVSSYAAMTIYTRIHHLDTFKRYNAYLIQPETGEGGDMVYLRRGVFRVTLRFTGLTEL